MNSFILERFFDFEMGIPSVCGIRIGGNEEHAVDIAETLNDGQHGDSCIEDLLKEYKIYVGVGSDGYVDNIETIWHNISEEETKEIYNYLSSVFFWTDRNFNISYNEVDEVQIVAQISNSMYSIDFYTKEKDVVGIEFSSLMDNEEIAHALVTILDCNKEEFRIITNFVERFFDESEIK